MTASGQRSQPRNDGLWPELLSDGSMTRAAFALDDAVSVGEQKHPGWVGGVMDSAAWMPHLWMQVDR